ncbi:MAG: hypothetical protein JJU21_05850 [Salinarimonas sp.]|nr:hypothetical protein [Salinarimonas sp.]
MTRRAGIDPEISFAWPDLERRAFVGFEADIAVLDEGEDEVFLSGIRLGTRAPRCHWRNTRIEQADITDLARQNIKERWCIADQIYIDFFNNRVNILEHGYSIIRRKVIGTKA